jgi:hypothetical protein
METKRRSLGATISGTHTNPFGTTSFSVPVTTEQQRTTSFWTGWPLVQAAKRHQANNVNYGSGFQHAITHADWGANFITERSRVFSTLSDHQMGASNGTNLYSYLYQHKGPALLGGHNLMAHYTPSELSNAEQQLFTLGAKAVKLARPNKPQIDLSVTIGELRKEGLPSLIGSLAGRTRTVKDAFRNGGSEYLNVQFGWGPIVRDLIALLKLIPETRKRIEQYERDIGKLVRRRIHFPVRKETVIGSTYSTQPSLYLPMAGTPWGSVPEDHISFRPNGQVPEQVTQTTEEIWFSGGFRFYHRSVPEALSDLASFEEKANLLLGTRLDPEVLWNLAPWTWLSDWFVNFGDVLGNMSAFLSDDLVMQYGYLMRHTTIETRVSWPQGIWFRRPISGFSAVWAPSSVRSYEQTTSREIKQRGRASPFGFGLNQSDFTADQWAILAALGMSRVK